jgi:hypothetical protein
MVQVIEIGKKVKHTMPHEQRTALIKKCRDEDEKMINGKFEFLDAVGGFFWIYIPEISGTTTLHN